MLLFCKRPAFIETMAFSPKLVPWFAKYPDGYNFKKIEEIELAKKRFMWAHCILISQTVKR